MKGMMVARTKYLHVISAISFVMKVTCIDSNPQINSTAPLLCLEDKNIFKIAESICNSQDRNNKQTVITPGLLSENLHSLTKIDLSESGIKGIPVELAKELGNVRSLNLNYRNFSKLDKETFKYFNSSVKELQLDNCHLTEKDFEVISEFKFLESLDIQRNEKLSLDSPHFLSIIKKLKHLNMSWCRLDSSVLKTVFGNAHELESLDLRFNDLSGFFESNPTISEKLRKNLKRLNISFCELTERDLPNIFNFENLEELNIRHNNFTNIESRMVNKIFYTSTAIDGSDYSIIQKKDSNSPLRPCFKTLKSLDLSYCGLLNSQSFIRKLFDLPVLESLNLDSNDLSFDLEGISKGRASDTLKYLNVNQCGITDPLNITELSNFKCLEFLNISKNNLESIPRDFSLGCSSQSLKKIMAHLCNLNSHGLRALTNCPSLVYLVLDNNDFGDSESNFEFGSSKDSLVELSILFSNLNVNGFRAISECSRLERLNISGNRFGSHISEDFNFGNLLDTLTEVEMSQCDLSYSGLKSLTKFKNIKKLNLDYNDFQNVPNGFSLGSLALSIKELSLNSANVNKALFDSLSQTENLETLELSYNDFRNFEFVFGEATTTLKNLEMSYCKLNYKHLVEIGKCPNLENLTVSNNNFSDFPESLTFENLFKSLQSLVIRDSDMNVNSLKAFIHCKNIKRLVASNNNFIEMSEDFSFERLEDSLRYLDLSKCCLELSNLKAIGNCHNIETLILSENNFSGKQSEYNFKLLSDSLQYLEMNNCNLKVSILDTLIKDCLRLRNLHAYGNYIDKYDAKENEFMKIIKDRMEFIVIY